MHLARFPRLFAARLPTPLGRMNRLSAELGGLEIWIKRDGPRRPPDRRAP